MRFMVTLWAECDQAVSAQEVKEAIERMIEQQERLDSDGRTIKFHKVRATQCESN